jgi:hypothetical protein
MPKLCVIQDWAQELPLMQQSVLIASVRGPDGIPKDHPVKVLCRYLRRSFLLSAFDKRALLNPYERGGGSFTGPCRTETVTSVCQALQLYLRAVDELPHHFQLHFMHAAEILGYKHPDQPTREWWHDCYLQIVSDAHLRPESEKAMDRRLGDCEKTWRQAK